MRIAFYAPLKAPDHPVPSGDRLMAQALCAALERAGHEVALASDLRAYLRDPDDQAGYADLRACAARERVRLARAWQAGAPDLWFCYHPYYKAPDLLGPALCAEFGMVYVTAEASYSDRRNLGIWTDMQARVLAGVVAADQNICLTARDMAGLRAAAPGAHLARLAPFIDVARYGAAPAPEPFHLITVAMMRPGDKFESYRQLGAALALLPDLPFVLSVVGDGPMRAEVTALFADLPAGRLVWHGQQAPDAIAALLARAALFVWPGCGEAYGLAYLEAQAAGVPVVAMATAGVPEVVADGETGLLVPAGDAAAFAAAVARLLRDGPTRLAMGQAARARVQRDHSTGAATATLAALVQAALREAR